MASSGTRLKGSITDRPRLEPNEIGGVLYSVLEVLISLELRKSDVAEPSTWGLKDVTYRLEEGGAAHSRMPATSGHAGCLATIIVA